MTLGGRTDCIAREALLKTKRNALRVLKIEDSHDGSTGARRGPSDGRALWNHTAPYSGALLGIHGDLLSEARHQGRVPLQGCGEGAARLGAGKEPVRVAVPGTWRFPLA